MAIKLLLLKSGEDMIADISEMAYGEDDSRQLETKIIFIIFDLLFG